MNLVFDRQYEIVAYLQDRLKTTLTPPFTTLGVERDGEIVGGWLFNEYNGHHVEVSVALDAPLTRGLIRAVKNYLFEQLKVRVVTARCRDSNLKSDRMMKRLGFHYLDRIPHYYGNEGARLYSYTKGA